TRKNEDQTGNATLVANIDEVRGEVGRLFKSNKAWEKLIPPIFNDQMRKARHYRSTHAVETDFKMPELNIFFSALVYKTTEGFNFEQNFEADPGFGAFEILHVEQDSPDSPLVVVTSYDKPLDWANREIYIEDMLDVHVFYHIPDNNLLFELTTSQVAL